MSKYCVTVNPHGGKKKGRYILEKVMPVFESVQADVTVIETEYAGHNRDIAREINITDYDGFCCVGGDGTMHESINGMLTREDKKRFPIGLITGGTGNSFMHDLDCLDPVAAVKRIINQRKRPIDVLECNANGQIYFSFNIVGWGMPTDVNNLAEKMRWMGTQRYNVGSMIEVVRHKNRLATVEIDGEIIVDNFEFIMGCNTINTGKGMQMAPLASLDDGLVDLVIVKRMSRLKLLKLFPKVFSGTHISDSVVDYRQVREFSIKPEIQNSLNIDGEILGSTPIHVKVLHKEIEVLV